LTPCVRVFILAILIFAALCLLAPPARAATNDLTTALQHGLFEEEANQNLGAAIQAYQTVANQFDKDRKLAATAIFRLGECYRKQGNTNDAATQYERILREFSDQPTLVTLSRQSLAGMGSVPPAPVTPPMSDAARQEQKRLLEEEIKLVQKHSDEQQKQMQAGLLVSSGDRLATERDLLKLKRQVAALDAGLPVSIAATETTAPATATEAEEVKRIQALIKDSPDLINAPDQKGVTLLESAAAKGKLAVVKVLLENGAAVDGLQQPSLTPLHYAAANGHRAIVDLLLSKGAKAEAQNQSGVTPLHLAARKGYETVAKALLAAGATVNVQTKGVAGSDTEDLHYHISPGQTPLHLAASAGYSGMVELLLAKGADVNAEDSEGRTTLSYAVQNHYQAILQVLLAAHANPNAGRLNLPLATAASLGDMPALKLLLANGADPNTNSAVNWSVRGASVGQDRHSPLSLAVSQGQSDAAKELLRFKADPNVTAPNQTPMLFNALADAPTLKVLLEGGANPNVRAPEATPQPGYGGGYPGGSIVRAPGTPLLLQTVKDKNQAAVELLLAHQADVNATNPDGWSSLQEAAAYGLKPIAELLLKGGATVDARNKYGDTPLQIAVRQSQRELVELLLAHQADANATFPDGSTPLHDVAQRGGPRDKAIAELLLKTGADVNARNQTGDTPLHLAVITRQPALAELLLANKADPNERNNAGQTPLDLAKSQAQSAQGPRPGETVYPGMVFYPGQAPGTPAPTPGQEAKSEAMAALLRRHGAVDELPKLDRIMAQRRSTGDSTTAFRKGDHDWGQFSLMDLIGVQYAFLAASPNEGGGDVRFESRRFASSQTRYPYPDLAHLRIRRPAPDLKSWQEQVVDLRPVLESGDCSKDVRLEWGDVVEIPEADHPLNEQWPGFSNTELANLMKCLTRQVEIVINGQATNITRGPRISYLVQETQESSPAGHPGPMMALREPEILAHTSFWLKPVLLQSKLVLTSSDLRHVKVTRHHAANGKEREWVVDCSNGTIPPNPSPDFWLRDGDKVEVPEKADSASAEEATPAPPSAPGISLPDASAAESAAQEAFNKRYGLKRRDVSAAESTAQEAFNKRYGLERRDASVAESTAQEAFNKRYGLEHLSIGGVVYSPKPDDPELLKDGYHRDRSAKPRKGECWEERAGAELRGRATSAVWTGTDMIVFGGEGMGTSFDDGARYTFAEDTWAALPEKGAPSSRTGHAMVWTGKEVIVWGGFGGSWGNNTNHNDGARYNPTTDAWKPVTTKNAPAARFDFAAVWTGREMLVWGGYTDNHSRYQGAHADAHLNTGGRYSPSLDSWRTITTQRAPSKRYAHTMVWTGKEMIVWGGGNTTKALNDGGCYSPTRDAWRPVSTDGAPSPRVGHVAVWTGKEMIVWGGTTRESDAQSVYFENGARYNPETDTWKPISTIGAPKGRVQSVAVWTGAEMIVWGGVNDGQGNGLNDSKRYVGTGARYNPATDTWTELTVTGAPAPRLTSGVWTGEGLLTFGGYNNTHLNDTWFYSPLRTLYAYVKQ
jgi:ankyrin repeat protein/N-acetylneuraminic acid mutarotase